MTPNLPQEDFDIYKDFKEKEKEPLDLSQELNNAPSVDNFFNAPQAAPEIPADWDEEWENDNSKAKVDKVDPSYFPPEKIRIDNRDHRPPLEQLPKTEKQRTPSLQTESNSALDYFLAGAGLDRQHIPEENFPNTMKMLGEVFREVVGGLKGLLDARSNIKNEFRLKQTLIGRTKNNPLQFSLNVEEAMTTLLAKDKKGYLSTPHAFQKSFDDIKAHELAILAGMQAALATSLARFNPKKIEEQINREGQSIGKLLTPKTTLYWEEFEQIYQRIVDEAEDDFYNMFGREFSRAYEEQIEKLNRRDR